MVSPLCEVKDGAGAYQATTSGVDVTPANTITIHLIDSSADVWSIECVYTDDDSDAATVTAALTIDTALRTATFTAPTAGHTYIFRSVVNSGMSNGRPNSSLTTTFGVYTLTSGRRVLAANETTEGGDFGWIQSVNHLIRNPTGLSALPGTSGQILTSDGSGDFGTPLAAPAGDLVGTSASQTLTNKTLTSPTIGGTPTLSGTSASTSNNAKGTCTDVNPVHVTTSDATVTTLDSLTLSTMADCTVAMSWLVSAIKSDGSAGAAYMVTAAYRVDSSTAAQIGATQVTALEDASGWDCTADLNSGVARLRVTGAAATSITWAAVRTQLVVIP